MRIPALVTEKQADIADLCQRADARRLDLFGSAVRDDFDPARSDLDFIVVFNDLAPVTYSDAFFSLKEGLERSFNRPVDLVVERSICKPYVQQRLALERQAIYAA
ncbi:MAG: nucleotidyltransferase domain-containing protein [Burkholderiaceae bacterium]|nr:nucleotidyltransferase domain-containing protein [Burkholderiaceae bacterium]